MKLKAATFNCNGIRARLPILLDWLKENSPDVLCLQETKVQDNDFPLEAIKDAGYFVSFWGQKSYNGVAILTRREPSQVIKGLPGAQADQEARAIAVLLDGVWVVDTYVPQGREVDDPAFKYKLDFLARLYDWFAKDFAVDQPFLWAGDFNIAPGPLDVYDPKRMEGKVCFHPAEHKALARVVEWGLTDLFRLHHPEEKQFTFWDYRLPASLKRNLGWRLDHLMATRPLAQACKACWVDVGPRALPKPSDHTFVLAEFELSDKELN